MKSGLVIGKFLPPHQGHLYLIRFARTWVKRLYIIVESVRQEPIDIDLRIEWMTQLCPDCIIVPLRVEMPQTPEEHPDFWNCWYRQISDILPESIDAVFASEAYGEKLAFGLNARFVPVDLNRIGVNISATKIRQNPQKYWGHIPLVVRRHLQLKVCIFGPESTGKTTLAQQLAVQFNGTFVPEYARSYLECKQSEPTYEDMLVIARGQSASEKALSALEAPMLFCDTDPLTTAIWSEWFFEECDPEIFVVSDGHNYDLTLLLSPDVPWVDDTVRYTPKDREQFLSRCMVALGRQHRSYVQIQGNWNIRFEQACTAVDAVLELQKQNLHWPG